MLIAKAERRDLPAILALQKIAYQSEAALLNNCEIPPLKQMLEDVSEEFEHGVMLKGMLDGKIIGSVRASSDGHTCYVGKLVVSPEHQRKGCGAQLLSEIEKTWPHSRLLWPASFHTSSCGFGRAKARMAGSTATAARMYMTGDNPWISATLPSSGAAMPPTLTERPIVTPEDRPM